MRKEQEAICGIYLITNKINGKKYVGQSTDILYRWGQHISYINKLRHKSLLKSAFQHYGIDNFNFEIIEICSPEELDDKEKYYINKYNTYYLAKNSNGYNMTLGGNGQNGYGKSVKQYDLDGNFIRIYNTIIEAALDTGVKDSSIVNCCAKRRNCCGGYMWCYADEEIVQPCKRRGKRVCQYDLQGNYIRTFNSAAEAGRCVNRERMQISQCCRSKKGSVAKFQWRYEGDIPPGKYVCRS